MFYIKTLNGFKDKRLGNPPGVLGAMLLKEGFFLVCADDLESPIKR